MPAQRGCDGLARLARPAATLSTFTCAGFVRRELRVERPIIDVRLFGDAGFAVINLGNVLVNLSAFAVMLLAPFYLQWVVDQVLPAADHDLLAVLVTGFALLLLLQVATALLRGWAIATTTSSSAK